MKSDQSNLVLQGVSLAPGLAMGKAFVFRDLFDQPQDCRAIDPHDIDAEFDRIGKVFEKVMADLQDSASRMGAILDPVTAGIFDAHAMMLRDKSLLLEIRAEMEKSLQNAECVVERVFSKWVRRLGRADDENLRLRKMDFEDIGRRLLRGLLGIERHFLESVPKGAILVAENLLPSDTVFFPERDVAGIVTVQGGPGSHSALLTRQIGIPGVCHIEGLMDAVNAGDEVAVDGMHGEIVVRPDDARKKAFEQRRRKFQRSLASARKLRHDPAVTLDLKTIPVMANIGTRGDSERAAKNGADGIGLYRSETLFLAKPALPSEDELVAEMRKTLEPFRDKPVAVRLLDIGGDKTLSYLRLPAEENSFLGLRGVRLLLRHRELLRLQLRALVRLDDFKQLQIIVPMVTFPEEMAEVRNELETIVRHMTPTRVPELGPMIETPAAALNMGELGEVSDFVNIGTNDLTQFVMAAGRENALVADYFRHNHHVVFRLIAMVSAEAGELPVSVCGELAGEHAAVSALVRAGVSSLSVAPPLIPAIKEAVRRTRVFGATDGS